MKRALSFMLAVIMVLSLVPSAFAAEDTVLINSNGLKVTHNGTMFYDYNYESMVGGPSEPVGSVQWQASGSQILGVATPDEKLQTASELTFTNEKTETAILRFEYTLTHENEYAEIWGVNASPVEIELDSGESITITLISPDPIDGTKEPAVLTITGLSLAAEGSGVTTTFLPVENGTYTVDGEKITGVTPLTAAAGTMYSLSAVAADGYRFFGWYNGTEYLSYAAQASFIVSQDQEIWPVFIEDTVAIFNVGSIPFYDLSAADAFANGGTIVLTNNGTLTGEHTISAGNTLLIPYNDANTVHTMATSIAVENGTVWENKAWETPRAYRTLTMADGAKLTIAGSLNVGGRHSAGPFLTAGSPSGDLGMIRMAEGTNITVADGGVVYCWGYIYGDGTVSVKDGGSVHENFQFSDFRGGNVTVGLAKDFNVFPLSQYYVQNIEVAATFEHGATEFVWGSLFMQGAVLGTSVKFIGNDSLSMFVPGEDGVVTKTYDPKTDRLHIDVKGTGSINPMGLELSGIRLDTVTFVLPINSNMTINIKSGTTTLNQSLGLLPGVELNIDKGATLNLTGPQRPLDPNGNVTWYKGGNNLIVYDRDQWLNAYKPVFNNGILVGAAPVEAYFVYTNQGVKRLQPVAWSPSRTGTRTEADLKDAVVDINGQLIANGFIYTTVDIDLQAYFYRNELIITGGGASVISSEGNGSLVMNNGMGPDNITLQPIQTGNETEDAYIPMVSARLQNEDGSYLDTFGAAAGATYKYCPDCNCWFADNKDQDDKLDHECWIEITWVVDGEDMTQEFKYGTKPVYRENTDPVKEGFTFIGWSTNADNEPEFTSANLPEAT